MDLNTHFENALAANGVELAESLRDGIRRVLEDPGLAADLRARGLARARECSWKQAALRHRALYRELAGV